jgi:hypothetical protein
MQKDSAHVLDGPQRLRLTAWLLMTGAVAAFPNVVSNSSEGGSDDTFFPG